MKLLLALMLLPLTCLAGPGTNTIYLDNVTWTVVGTTTLITVEASGEFFIDGDPVVGPPSVPDHTLGYDNFTGTITLSDPLQPPIVVHNCRMVQASAGGSINLWMDCRNGIFADDFDPTKARSRSAAPQSKSSPRQK